MRAGKQRADGKKPNGRHDPAPTADDLKIDDLALEDDDERVAELEIVSSIFPEFVSTGPYSGSFDIEVNPSVPISVRFPAVTANAENRWEEQEIAHLPPLNFQCWLPKNYPTDAPPTVKLECSWLQKEVLEDLDHLLLEQWQSVQDQSVFAYIDTLQSSAERLFDLPFPLELPVSLSAKIGILDYNSTTKQRRFDESTFDCGICLEPKKGSVCFRVSQCFHVFCRPCLTGYFTAMIDEGAVGSVHCLDPSCGKDQPPDEITDEHGQVHRIPKQPGAIAPAELETLIGEALLNRYMKLKRKLALEANKDTIYCPRQFCQGPALRAGKNDKLAVCLDCKLAFCVDCQKTWHGYTFTCRVHYIPVTEQSEADALSADYVSKLSTPCPTCLIPIEKTGGCNHMCCVRCRTHFCLLCGAYLYADNPYSHFNQDGSPCFNRLWEGMDDGVIQRAATPPPAEPEAGAEAAPMVIGLVANNDAPPPPQARTLSSADDRDFAILFAKYDTFREGFMMLEENLTVREIVDMLTDYAMLKQGGNLMHYSLGEMWRRKLDWVRGVRGPRMELMGIAGRPESDELMAKMEDAGNRREGVEDTPVELMARWLEIWEVVSDMCLAAEVPHEEPVT